MKIIISVPSMWSVRNFFLSGIIDHLSENHDIYFLIDAKNDNLLVDYGVPKEKTILVNKHAKSAIIHDLIRYGFLLKHPELKYLSKIMNSAGIGSPARGVKNFLKNFLFNNLSFILKSSAAFKSIENLFFSISASRVDKLLLKKINEINPDFILSTIFVSDLEFPVIFSAWKLKIPIYTHVLSFDNITSRGYLPISKLNKYLVWNTKMKDELVRYYQVEPQSIFITGTPQFDFHLDCYFSLERPDALSKLGLSINDHYILYCANHYNISPNEPELLESVLKILVEDEDLSSRKIVVRLHPMDNYERWNAISDTYGDRVNIVIPWDQPKTSKSNGPLIKKSDMVALVSQLRHADVVLNIASTISIDAALTKTPVICLGFHPNNEKESACYYNYHFSDHYKPIMDLNCIPLVRNSQDLKRILKSVILDKDKFLGCSDKINDYFIGNGSRKSKDLILDLLMK